MYSTPYGGTKTPYYQSQPNLQGPNYSQPPNNFASQPNLSQQQQPHQAYGQQQQFQPQPQMPQANQQGSTKAISTQTDLDKSPQWYCLLGAIHIRHLIMGIGGLATIASLIVSVLLIYLLVNNQSAAITIANAVCPARVGLINRLVSEASRYNDEYHMSHYGDIRDYLLYGTSRFEIHKLSWIDAIYLYSKDIDSCMWFQILLRYFFAYGCIATLVYVLLWAIGGVILICSVMLHIVDMMYFYGFLRGIDVLVSLGYFIMFVSFYFVFRIPAVFMFPFAFGFFFHLAVQGWIFYLLFVCRGYLTAWVSFNPKVVIASSQPQNSNNNNNNNNNNIVVTSNC